MTDETVDCFNCGRANPEWAQVCRTCGVALRHGEARIVPSGRFPTDRGSLLSMGAVIATILGALLLGLFVSSLNPTGGPDPTVAADESPTPRPTARRTATAGSASAVASASTSVAPTPSPTPALPGTIVFGTELDGNSQVIEPVETFTPGMVFAHSISTTAPFGAATIGEQVVRLNEDGSEGEEIVAAAGNQLSVSPEGSTAGFVAGDAANFVRDWGPGTYEMRVYVGETLIARGRFQLAAG
jgi:hypothetical protein